MPKSKYYHITWHEDHERVVHLYAYSDEDAERIFNKDFEQIDNTSANTIKKTVINDSIKIEEAP